jgi:hypothetical protein
MKNEIQRPRHGDARGGRDAQAEEAEEARQVGAVAEIGDGVDGGKQPQEGRQREEQERESVDAEHELELGQQRQSGLVDRAAGDAVEHHRDERELGEGAEKVDGGAQAVPGLVEQEDDDGGDERGRQYQERHGCGHHNPSMVDGSRPICSRS